MEGRGAGSVTHEPGSDAMDAVAADLPVLACSGSRRVAYDQFACRPEPAFAAPPAVDMAVSPKLQGFLDKQMERREARRAAGLARGEELKAQAKVDLEAAEKTQTQQIDAKRQANRDADEAAKEFFATEANSWAKIVEYCDVKPKAQAKDQPKAKDTTRLRGMLLDLKHNPKV